MNDERSSTGLAAGVVLLAATIALVTVYVAGYFVLSEKDDLQGTGVMREFDHEWLLDVYLPAAAVEQAVTGGDVSLAAQEGVNFIIADPDL
jgi:hypothetical protein